MKEYLAKFKYGNQDLLGDKGQNNGLTNAWLSSSLEISPEEQVWFLQKLIHNKLPVSLKAHEMTKKIMFIEHLENGWKLYGKSGSGWQLSADRSQKLRLRIGWFIGWIQKDKRTIIFVQFIKDKIDQGGYAGPRATSVAKMKLLKLIKGSNNI